MLYLESTLTASELERLLVKLNITARELLRKGEQAYKERQLADQTISSKALITAMVEQPKLIERPIVVKGDKAVLGRPPENVLALL